MEKTIKRYLKIAKVKEMTNPAILMNKTDFEDYKKLIESKVQNLKVGNHPTFEGIPVKESAMIEKGKLIILDVKI